MPTPPSTRPSAPIPLPIIRGLSLVPVTEGLWRVSNPSGMVLGHIERRTEADGDRFAARRLLAATRTMNVGSFWRIDDAADCFR
ncbi:MAG TPA: hypothetical protein VLO31_08945 [Cryobacterium sp.]|nr:hypothetical protein [Cryobacterium sp.]